MPFSFELIGDRQVVLKFEEFPQQAHDAFLERITRITNILESRVEAAEPQRTGKLRESTGKVIYDGKDAVVGRVKIGKDFAKAAALEYGAHQTTNVAQHVSRLNHVYARMISPMAVIVAAHSRKPNIKDVRYLRNPLASMQSDIMEQLQQALLEAVERPA
jgi:hypothetical protein